MALTDGGDYMNPVLDERYALLRTASTDMGYHLPALVQTVHDVSASAVIELGVRYGVSTIGWLYALEGRGHLWSVDCSFPVIDPETGIELLNPQGPLGVQRDWTFILGYDIWHEVLDALPQDVDVVMIDTQHTYEETSAELELYYPRVRPGGRILLHDTALESTGNATTPQPPFPVKTAIEEFCNQHNLERSYVDESFGMGTIYA